ncbi:MAG TPA: hypothetical protein VF660_04780, partial [Actinomycetota bacterium]
MTARRTAPIAVALVILTAACEGQTTIPSQVESPSADPGHSVTPSAGEASSSPSERHLKLRRVAWVDGLRPVVVANGSNVSRYDQGHATLVGNVDGQAEVAFAARRRVVVQVDAPNGSSSDLFELKTGSTTEPIEVGNASHAYLQDVAVIDGRHRILYTTFVGEGRTSMSEKWGFLYLQDLETGAKRRLALASAPEFGIERASYGSGVIVVSSQIDLTERFTFLSANGGRLRPRPNPTDELEYAQPPYMSNAVLSPDAREMAYLEGPDSSPDSGDLVGSWVAVVVDQKTGKERFHLKVSDQNLCVTWLDFDGRWLVISRSKPGS